MDRRTFLSWFGIGWIASSLPVVIAAFSLDKQQSVSAAPGDFKIVGTVSQLTNNGQILVKQGFDSKPILVVGDPKTSTVVAVNPTCTHQGCLVNWKASQSDFVCPCHNSRFSADGEVLRGPATRALQTYTVKVQGEQVLVQEPAQ
ncbi:MAG: ubiquinol-cytochrome c reductase iron-sulfur subunit [Chroococcidiopsidaceae cyanobacterium CP_BM_RX_35]|nr:ubiquinol-cytochrome c reductase iron-sulfur subunit [Chroococcidiopsidaceae cyanobacterium CP_BM_RX_35]